MYNALVLYMPQKAECLHDKNNLFDISIMLEQGPFFTKSSASSLFIVYETK